MRITGKVVGAAVLVAALVLPVSGCCPVCRLVKQAFGANRQAPTLTPGPQTTCPVLGGKINRQLYVDYEGKRIYVCCAGCIAKIRRDPAQYIAQLEAAGVILDQVPKTTR